MPSTPTLVQHISTSTSSFQDANTYVSTNQASAVDFYPAPSLSGNLLIYGIGFAYPNGVPSSWTIVDNLGSTWSPGITHQDSTGGTVIKTWYLPNSGVGVKHITVTPNVSINAFSCKYTEHAGIATTSPADTSGHGNSGNSTSATAGSFTTTSPGDLIWGMVISADVVSNIASITAGSGMTLLDADRIWCTATEYEIQSSAGAINPGFTLGSSQHWNMVAMAFKAASAGTLPTQAYWPRKRVTFWLDNASSFTQQFPTGGGPGNTMLSALWDGYGNVSTACHVSSVTDSSSNSWTSRVTKDSGFASPQKGPGTSQILDTDAATTSTASGMTVSISLNESAYECEFLLSELVNVPLASGNYDTSASANGNQTSGASPISLVSITPSTGGGLVVLQSQCQTGTMYVPSVSTSDAIYPWITTYPNESDVNSESLDENNMRAFLWPASSGSLTLSSTNDQASNSGIGFWSAAAAAYKGAASVVSASGGVILSHLAGTGSATFQSNVSSSVALKAVQSPGIGSFLTSASSAATLAPVQPPGVATFLAPASAAVTLSHLGGTGVATFESPVSASILTAPLASPASGTFGTSGSNSVTLAPLTSIGLSTNSALASASFVLSPLSAPGSGMFLSDAQSSIFTDLLSVSSGATFESDAASSLVLNPLAVSSSAFSGSFANPSLMLSPLSVASAGTFESDGSGSVSFGPIQSPGVGTFSTAAATSVSLSPLTTLATGVLGNFATSPISLSPIVPPGVATFLDHCSAAVTLGSLQATGLASFSTLSTVGIDLSPMKATGIGGSGIFGSGILAIGPLSSPASGTYLSSGSGSVDLSPLTAFSTASFETDASVVIPLAPLSFGGSGFSGSFAVGAIVLGPQSALGSGVFSAAAEFAKADPYAARVIASLVATAGVPQSDPWSARVIGQ